MLLTGNEAVAYGSMSAGVECFTGYPGTPCTEIGEILERQHRKLCEWSINEKVALEVAVGISLAGRRVLVGMKTLGLNVAADCLTQLTGTPLNGGIVIVVADDTGRIAADDYQDCRFYSTMARFPLLEPADSREAYDFARLAFDISERYSTPVLIRMNSIMCKSKSIVSNLEQSFEEIPIRKEYQRSLQKTVGNIVRFGLKNYDSEYLRSFWHDFEKKWQELRQLSDAVEVNFIEDADSDIGIITTGNAYNYVKELEQNVAVMKLGMAYPLPEKKLKAFAERYEKLYVIEDGHPVIEKELKSLGISVKGEEIFPRFPEMLCFNPDIIEGKLFKKSDKHKQYVPFRLPENCKGCPHRTVNTVLKELNIKAAGGIGCGALAAMPDVGVIDVVKCMGSSFGIAHGYNKLENEKMVAVMGDGEFWHTGLNGLINAYYNDGNLLAIIEDNLTTAMTGGQRNASSQNREELEHFKCVSIEKVIKAIGIPEIEIVDGYDKKRLKSLVSRFHKQPGIQVIITRKNCMLFTSSL